MINVGLSIITSVPLWQEIFTMGEVMDMQGWGYKKSQYFALSYVMNLIFL